MQKVGLFRLGMRRVPAHRGMWGGGGRESDCWIRDAMCRDAMWGDAMCRDGGSFRYGMAHGALVVYGNPALLPYVR